MHMLVDFKYKRLIRTNNSEIWKNKSFVLEINKHVHFWRICMLDALWPFYSNCTRVHMYQHPQHQSVLSHWLGAKRLVRWCLVGCPLAQLRGGGRGQRRRIIIHIMSCFTQSGGGAKGSSPHTWRAGQWWVCPHNMILRQRREACSCTRGVVGQQGTGSSWLKTGLESAVAWGIEGSLSLFRGWARRCRRKGGMDLYRGKEEVGLRHGG